MGWLTWISIAFAADQSDGVLLPGATPLESTVSLGASAGWAGVLFSGSGGALGLEGSVRLSERWAVLGAAAGLFSTTTSEAPVYPISYVSLRYHAYSKDNFRFAPMLTVLSSYGRPLEGHIGLGLAIEGGGPKLRGDLTIPSLVALSAGLRGNEYGLFFNPVASYGEFGGTFLLGEHHRLRIGLPTVLTWKVVSEHVYFEIGGTFLLLAAMGTVELGGRF